MALNWTMLDDSKQPVPLGGEHTVMTIDRGAEVILSIPDPNIDGTQKRLKGSGRIWLTEQRLIFVGSSTPGEPTFESLSIPLASLLSTSFIQPTFAANYLAIDIKPAPGGGLTQGTKAEIRLKDQAMFGFVSALEKVRGRALFMKRESALEDELPVYSSPSTFAGSSGGASRSLPPVSTSVSASANVPADAPPGYDA
ncbi:hypothetical protein K439DRAFT_1400990 [Ramaria rubella]|nr:hypothetical protein K439DRAFT_1400990 [Ramaria rubella]